MKNFYLVLVLICFFSSNLFAQFTIANGIIKDDLIKYNQNYTRRSTSSLKICLNDTVEYTRYKATAFNGISVAAGSSLGQFYSAPQDVTVYGFSFFAWNSSTAPNNEKKIRLICNLYAAGTDSLPMGSPLRSDTVIVDSTFGGGQLSVLEKRATFKSPITVNYSYILTVESDSAAPVYAGMVANSWTAADGKKENLACGSVSGLWYRCLNLNISGTTLDADIQIYPHVKYTLGNDFTIKYDCYKLTDSVQFVNNSRNTVVGSRFYNRYAFYNNFEQYCHLWSFGDNFNQYNGIDKKYLYSTKGNYNVRLISNNYYWRNNNMSCLDTTIKPILFQPSRPLVTGQEHICVGDYATLYSNVEPGAKALWYNSPSDTSPFLISDTLNTGILTASKVYYVKAKNSLCESSFRSFGVTLNKFPDDPSILDDSICTNSSANLFATSNYGTINWFEEKTDGKRFYNGNTYATDLLQNDTTFYVEANNNGCLNPSGRIAVTAHVNSSFAPSNPLVSPDTTVCLSSGASVTMWASASNTIRWFNTPSGGTPINTGSTYTFTPTTIGTKTIYVDAYDGSCASSRLAINAIVDNAPNLLTTITDTICSGKTARISATSTTGYINWYKVSSNGSISFVGNTFTTPELNSNTTYYVETQSNGCKSSSRFPVNIIVRATPSFSYLKKDTICQENTAVIKATPTSGNNFWFYDTLENAVGTGNVFTTPFLIGNNTYYAQAKNFNCYSAFTPVFVLVKTRPISGFNYSVSWPRTVTLTPINASGCSVLWQYGDGTTATTANGLHTYSQYGTYSIKLTLKNISTNCYDSTEIPITVDFTRVTAIHNISQISVFPNPNNGKFDIKLNAIKDDKNAQLKIIDVVGKHVYNSSLSLTEGENAFSFDQTLNTGIYFVTIESKSEKAVIRILVE